MKIFLPLFTFVFITFGAYGASGVGQIDRLLTIADSLHSCGRTDSAAVVGEEAVGLARQSGDKLMIISSLSSQGVYLRTLGRIDDALACYNDALEIVTSEEFRNQPDSEVAEEVASLYINLAVLNLDMQHKDEAAANARFAGQWASRCESPDLQSTIYGVVGSVLTACGEYADALRFQGEAFSKAMECGEDEAAFRAATYAMLTASRIGDAKATAGWRDKCAALLPSVESVMALLAYYQAECSICLRAGDNAGALVYFRDILSLDGIENLPFVVFDCYNNMHLAHAGLGEYKEAYETLAKATELRDSLWQKEKAESLRDLTVKYETKETELALARSEARRATTLMWLIAAAGLLVVALIAFIAYSGRQRRQRMRREMEYAAMKADIARQLTEQYVEGLENERRRMARELHDGVCNDLLAIGMNIRNGESIDSTAHLVDSCRESVRRISHELMPPEFAYATIEEVIRFFAGKLASTAPEGVTINFSSTPVGSIGWASVPDPVALEIYRIVQEAAGNALRHSGASTINISLTLEERHITATVTDNGTHSVSGRKGLGLDSMRRRATSIGGSVEISMPAEGGTAVIMHANF